MNKAWFCAVVMVIMALPDGASGQFDNDGSRAWKRAVLEIDAKVTPDYRPIVSLPPAEEQALWRNLERLESQQVRADYAKEPLASVIAGLETNSGISITLDTVALEEAGIDVNEKVTLVRTASLRTVLEGVCEPLGLRWFPYGKGLRITAYEQADSAGLLSVVYPVGDLVSTPVEIDYDSLIELITTTVEPNTWKEGGTGEATVAPFEPSRALTINAPWRVHEQIQQMLVSLRIARQRQGIRGWSAIETVETPDEDAASSSSPPPRGRTRVRWSAPQARK